MLVLSILFGGADLSQYLDVAIIIGTQRRKDPVLLICLKKKKEIEKINRTDKLRSRAG